MFALRRAPIRLLAASVEQRPTTASVRYLASAAVGVSAPFPSASAEASSSSASASGSETYAGPGPWADSALPTSPAARPLNRYIVIAEDFSDKGALARRIEVRERHLEHARRGKLAGRIELGGALLRRDFTEIDVNEPALYSMGGSIMIVRGESLEDVRQRVSQDEYILNGVWDISKLRIYPLVQAMESTLTQIKVPPPQTRPEPTQEQVQAAAEASVKAAAEEAQHQQKEEDPSASLFELRQQEQKLRTSRAKMTLSALRKAAQAQAAARASGGAPSSSAPVA
ncbi:hypothetical protein A4X13_0g2730 [Tilletia indica]|uniref:YCII-related domain-containing protein n=1 Tax=Tilletia indica TaxID=43049 RepID=A0A177TSY8_9BASI|nr:hypothetical protein A4X13_0g2730 [Tilletia indica]